MRSPGRGLTRGAAPRGRAGRAPRTPRSPPIAPPRGELALVSWTRRRRRRSAVLNGSPINRVGAARINPPLRSALRMPFQSLPFDPATHYVDVHMMGVAGFGAIYLIDEEEKALVEAGASNDVTAILGAGREFRLRPA